MLDQNPITLVPDEDGNYDSPTLQALLALWEAYDEEEVDEPEVLAVIEQIESLVHQQVQSLEEAVERGQADRMDPARVVVLLGFQEHLAGLQFMRRFFAEDDDELIDEGLERIQKATNAMILGYQQGAEGLERSAPKACLRCSATNERHAATCRSCGAMLPRLPETARTTLLAIDEIPEAEGETMMEFATVADAVEDWRAKRINAARFNQTLESAVGVLQSDYQETLTSISQCNHSSELKVNLESIAYELAQSLKALSSLKRAVATADESGVAQAMSDFAEATLELMSLEDAEVLSQAA